MTVALECHRMTSGYGEVPVVRDLSLEVQPGQVVALLGPNGAGKTTVLLTLAGILRPSKGRVSFFGKPVPAGHPHRVAREGLTLVPDDRGLCYGLSVRDNLSLARCPLDEAIATVIEYFPALESKLHTRVGLLSGGEQQMLAVGRAIAAKARALMIDELSQGLAPIATKSILPIIRRAAEERGTAVLIVEQHLDFALKVADRVYVLNHGELKLSSSCADARERPEILRSSYLGEVTAIEGSVASSAGGSRPRA